MPLLQDSGYKQLRTLKVCFFHSLVVYLHLRVLELLILIDSAVGDFREHSKQKTVKSFPYHISQHCPLGPE